MPELATRIESAELAVFVWGTGEIRFQATVTGDTFQPYFELAKAHLSNEAGILIDGRHSEFYLWSCAACRQLWKKPAFGHLPRFCDARCKARHGMRQLRRRRRESAPEAVDVSSN